MLSNQLFISLSAIYLAFQLSFPQLIHKVFNGLIHLLIIIS